MGTNLSRCIAPGPHVQLLQAVQAANLEAIRACLDGHPELVTRHNLSGRETVWHVAAACGHGHVLALLYDLAAAAAAEEAEEADGEQGAAARGPPLAAAGVAYGAAYGATAGAASRAAAGSGERGQGQGQGQGGPQHTADGQGGGQGRGQGQQQGQGGLGGHVRRRTLGRASGLTREQLRGALDAPASLGQTPLMFAASEGHVDAVRWLLQQGADPWATDRCGRRTALHYAAMRGRLGCAEVLLCWQQGPEMLRYAGVRTVSGMTPLHYAAANGHAAVASFLLRSGADLLATNLIGVAHDLSTLPVRSTPLHAAAYAESVEVALELLRYYHLEMAPSHTNDPRRRRDALERTPHQVAQSRRNVVLAELLHPSSDLAGMFDGGPPLALPRTLQTGGSGTSSSSGSGAGAGDEAGVRAEGPAAAGAGAGAGAAEVDAARTVGVPRLAKIAEAAVRRQLKEDIEHAERVISAVLEREDLARCAPEIMAAAEQQPILRPWVPSTKPHPPPCKGPCSVLPVPALPPCCAVRAAATSPFVRRSCNCGPRGTSPVQAGAQAGAQATGGQPRGPGSGDGTAHMVDIPPPQPEQLPAAAVVAVEPVVVPSCPPSTFEAAPVVPVVACAVCYEDAYSLVLEPCHHRLCAGCCRLVLRRAAAMPMPCPVCREVVAQVTSPVC